jgi:hypothetical protein
MMCRHCNQLEARRPRQLCWLCYRTPGVRNRYPSSRKFAHRGLGNFNGNRPLPAFPTQAVPGTPEKIAVLAERAHLKLNLFHPDDVTEDNPGIEILRAS